MRRFKYLKSVLVSGVVLTAACSPTSAQMMKDEGRATFNAQGETTIPEGFRLWPFIGAPLTPNGLNGGEAGFPEFHHVYIDPNSFAEYRKTGKFPEGTTIVKELVLLQKGDYEDGSKDAPSGRGFFASTFNGIDMMVKDTKRFSETQGWGFFNFGHHSPPYAEKAAAAPADACAACHEANADEDMVFKNMYPILNQKK